MPKYQSVSDLRQAVILEGNRVLMLPGDIIESSRELKYVFLEEVSADVPVTLTKTRRVTSMVELQEKVEELESEKESATLAGKEELEAVAQTVEQMRSDIKQIAEEETGKVSGRMVELEERFEQVETMFENYVQSEAKIEKRLNMMKSAMMTMQEDFYDIEFDVDGRAVTDGTKSE